MLAATLRRRLLALPPWPTRRQLARCGRPVGGLAETSRKPPGNLPVIAHAELPAPAAAIQAEGGVEACATCGAANWYRSRVHAGLRRCRACGTEAGDG